MDDIIYIEVELDRIPSEFARTFKRRDGSPAQSVQLCIGKLQQPDSYGNTYYVKMRPPKNYTGELPSKGYCGRGRGFQSRYNNQNNSAQPQTNATSQDEPPI